MADETDVCMEAPATGLAPESVGRIGVVFGSSLSCPTFFFGGVGPLSFRVKGALVDHAFPGWSVRCCVFPGGDVNVEVLEVSNEQLTSWNAGAHAHVDKYKPTPRPALFDQNLSR